MREILSAEKGRARTTVDMSSEVDIDVMLNGYFFSALQNVFIRSVYMGRFGRYQYLFTLQPKWISLDHQSYS